MKYKKGDRVHVVYPRTWGQIMALKNLGLEAEIMGTVVTDQRDPHDPLIIKFDGDKGAVTHNVPPGILKKD